MRFKFFCRMQIIALLFVLAPASCQALAGDVPKWSTYDLALTASGSYANPYTAGPSFTATFTRPGGVTKKVTGFWDGKKVYKIRFTPTAEGEWTYTTSSTDSGLNNKTGSINATAPAPGRHGFPRVDPKHNTSFVWDDGTRYFMWGQTYYDLMQDAMVNDNWKTAADKSMAYGMNKIRMRVYAQGGFAGIGNVDHGYADVVPYAGKAASPDRDSLNLAYWRKLDQVVQYLDSKGIVANLILLSTYANSTMPGTQAQDERYVKYIVSRYAAYPNVIWDITNEWASGGKPQSYFNSIGKLVRNSDPWLPNGPLLRPLSIHQNTGISFEYFGADWPTHVIIQLGPRNRDRLANGDQWGNAGIVKNLGHNMPVVNDEYGYIADLGGVKMTQTQVRQAIWGIAAAGGYGSSGDIRMFGSGTKQWTPCKTGEWADAPEYGDLKRMLDFFATKGIEYWKMASHNEFKTAGARTYVLAEPGRQYIVYAATGGSVALKLAAGTYHAERYNPRTGESSKLPAVTGGSTQAFSLPDSNDWVVHLRASQETPSPAR